MVLSIQKPNFAFKAFSVVWIFQYNSITNCLKCVEMCGFDIILQIISHFNPSWNPSYVPCYTWYTSYFFPSLFMFFFLVLFLLEWDNIWSQHFYQLVSIYMNRFDVIMKWSFISLTIKGKKNHHFAATFRSAAAFVCHGQLLYLCYIV